MAGGYLEMAQRARRRAVVVEPLSGAAPCPRCGAALAWQTSSGVRTCAGCQRKPDGFVTKMVLVEVEGCLTWEPYPICLTAKPSDETVDVTWETADEIVPCPSCGSLMAWWDAKDRRRCMDCDPPTKARQLIRDRDRIIRQQKLRPKRPE